MNSVPASIFSTPEKTRNRKMSLLQKIREAFAKLGELTPEQLSELRADIVKCRKELDTGNAVADAEALSELADIGEGVINRLEAIKQEEAEAEARAQAARDRLNALDEGDETEADPADTSATDPETEATEPTATDALPIAAGGKGFKSTPRQMKGDTSVSPELAATEPSVRIVASSGLPGKNYGDEFNDKMDLARVMSSKLTRMDRRSANGRAEIASISWDHLYPDEKRLTMGVDSLAAASANTRKLRLGFEKIKKGGLAPIAASGGVPLPTNIDYAMDTWASAERPVRAGLDSYAVDRGGLLYRQPPTLAALADATTIWTNANDIDPTDPTTKPVLQVVAQDTTQVFISAVPTRLGFGNLMGQFDPETIAANTDLAIAAAARIAETNLINTIAGFSVNPSATPQVMGASRDLVQAIIQVCAAYRFQYRLDRDLTLSILLPSWAMDLFKADRVWELAHDSAGSFDPFMIDDSYIDRIFAAQNIDPIYAMDALPVNSSVVPHYVTQNFTAFTTNSAIPVFPTALVYWIFIKGSLQFLDGGRLDLGVVRDSTLDATNDYETFVETFENVANRSFTGGVVQVISDLLPTGASSEGIAA
jgi:hypothetical protein